MEDITPLFTWFTNFRFDQNNKDKRVAGVLPGASNVFFGGGGKIKNILEVPTAAKYNAQISAAAPFKMFNDS